MMVLLWVLAYPISKLLDCILGHDSKTRFNNTDLKALIELHSIEALDNLEQFNRGDEMGLTQDQLNLMLSSIDLFHLNAEEVMLPYHKVNAFFTWIIYF